MTILSEHPATRPAPADQRRTLITRIAAVAAFEAAVIHAVVTPEHLEEAPAAGWFFLVVAVLQVGLAVAVLRPLPVPALVAALVANVGVVVLYVASRTFDLAFLPVHGGDHLPVAGGIGNGDPDIPGAHMEPVGALDLACLGAELVLLAMLTALLPPRLRGRATTAMAFLAIAGLVARGAVPLT